LDTGLTTRTGLRAGAALIAGLVIALGLTATFDAAGRGNALQDAAKRAEPLAIAAEEIYRDLSDADATAAEVFLSGAQAGTSGLDRYNADIRQVAAALAAVSADAGSSPQLRAAAAQITADLPVYTNLVGTAQANGRQNLPIGAAYLREASALMRADLLPAAQRVLAAETGRLAADGATASAGPEAELALAVVAVAVLCLLQLFLARRTHRLANPGIVAATLVVLTVALWAGLSGSGAADSAGEASAHRSAADALATTDLAVLRAHGDELLTLAAREDVGSYEQDFQTTSARLTALLTADRGYPIGDAEASYRTWLGKHRALAAQEAAPQSDNSANLTALAQVTRTDAGGSGSEFTRIDTAVRGAVHAQELAYLASINAGRSDVAGLAAGCAVLAAAALIAAGHGVNQRLREYR
jgi:hypothetical protein